jgi:glycosyltransferase involved in cell wall biosynthesis
MRICYVNPFFHPYIGGIEKHILEISSKLAKKHEVHVITSKLKSTTSYEKIENVHVHRLPCLQIPIYNPPLLLDSPKKIVEKLKQIRPHIINLHTRWYLAPVLGTILYAKENNTKVIVTWHNSIGEGNLLLKPFSFILDKIAIKLLKHCSKVIAVSNFVREQLIKHGAPSNKVVTIPNGFNRPIQEYELPSDNSVVFVGRLVSTKGIETLIKAASIVTQKYPKTKFYIVGKGPNIFKLKALTLKLGLKNKVIFTGFVPERIKNFLVAKAAVFVLPSIYESAGLACLEAMSLGKAVIVSSVGGLPEYVTNNKTGILVPPKDPKALADKIMLLLSNEKLRKKLGKAAKEQAAKFLTWDDVAASTERLFNSVYKTID